jgi:surface protein
MANTIFSWDMGAAFLNFGGTEIIFEWADTSNVTNMGAMFQWCSNLTWLDLSDFDTSNVDNMSSMCLWCNNLGKLDLSNFDTSNVTNVSDMFNMCYKLENLSMDSWDFSKIIGKSSMFYWTNSLKTLSARNRIIPENFTNLITTAQLYGTGLSIDVSNWDLSKTKNIQHLFWNSTAREIKWLDTWDTSSVTNVRWMFE